MAERTTLRRHWKGQLNGAAPKLNANIATDGSKFNNIWTAALTIFVDINNHSGETNMHRMAESQQQLRMCHVNWPVLRKVKLKGEATLEGEVTSESPTSSYSLKKNH